MAQTIFSQAMNEREKDQETKKAMNGLGSKKQSEQIHLSIPADCKEKFTNYCKAHYTSPSAQLRAWIDQFCED